MSKNIHIESSRNSLFPIIIIGVLFFIFGFITWANSQLIPYLKIACQLTDTQSYLVGSAFFAAYFFMSIPSSIILKKIGYKKGMSLGLFVMAIGALLFIPAAQTLNYNLFLLGLFIIGTGLALLQSAANPYVTVVGPIEKAGQRISIMGVCNKLAGACAVYVLGFIMLKDADVFVENLNTLSLAEKEVALKELASRVIMPYTIIALALCFLGLLLLFAKLPEIQEEESANNNGRALDVLKHRNLVLGALAIFFYVGAEVITYDAFSTFGKTLGFTENEASSFATYTAIMMIVGYFIGIALMPKFISQRKALIISSVSSIVVLILSMLTTGMTAVYMFAFLGVTQAMMWPAIWPLALNGLKNHTKLGGAILVMMIVGGAVLLPLMGIIAEWINDTKSAFLILIPCWIYLIYYAVYGYKSVYITDKN